MRGVKLDSMPITRLRRTIFALSCHQELARVWHKSRCIKWLEQRGVHEINVGNFCRTLLRVTLEKNGSGFAVGLNYEEMTKIVKAHFPHSMVNERHFSFYATTMRAAGEMIPVYREPYQK